MKKIIPKTIVFTLINFVLISLTVATFYSFDGDRNKAPLADFYMDNLWLIALATVVFTTGAFISGWLTLQLV